jgi:uncharacterized protein (TIGR02996 family)
VGLAHLPNLILLNAWDNSGITDAGLAHLPNLTMLAAEGNSGITDAGLAHLPNLTELNVQGNRRITGAGLVHLPNLTTLNAGRTSGINPQIRRQLIRQRRILVFLRDQPAWPAGLATVAHNLHEPGPRLVYADWLEEQGDARADQLRLAMLTKRGDLHRQWRQRCDALGNSKCKR